MSSISAGFTADKAELVSLPNDAMIFTIAANEGAWTLTNSNNKLGTSNAKNINMSSKGTTTWTISIDAKTYAATIASTNTKCGKILYNVNSPRFLNYTSSPNASMLLPQIYKLS